MNPPRFFNRDGFAAGTYFGFALAAGLFSLYFLLT